MKLTKQQLKQLIKEELKEGYHGDDPRWEASGKHTPYYTSHGADYERFEPEFKMTKLHPDHPDYEDPEREMQRNHHRACYGYKKEEGWTEEEFERCKELADEYYMDEKEFTWARVLKVIDEEAGRDPHAESRRRADTSYDKAEAEREREEKRSASRVATGWAENKKLTKPQLTKIIREELALIKEELESDFVRGETHKQASSRLATPQSSKGGTPAIAVAQALAGKIGQQATQFIMGKLSAVDVHALVKMLGSQK